MNKKIINYLLFFISIFLIFNHVPKLIQMNFIGSILGNQLAFYPVFIGMLYTLYCQNKYKNVFVHFDKFLKFVLIYIFVMIISTIIGLYNYPYYDLLLNGPITQIEKLPKVLEILNDFGINADVKLLTALWMVARTIKGILFEVIYTFGGTYMIYCWYYDDWQKGVNIFIRGILVGLLIVIGYGCIEVCYLAGCEAAKNILIALNPYIHVIKITHNWWPPLLWAKQVRSVFTEPSHFGNYVAFALPVLYCLIIESKAFEGIKINKLMLFLFLFLFNILVFLTQARTAIAMFFGIFVLCILLLLYLHKKDYLKNFVKIIIVTVISFLFSLMFINNFINKSVVTKNINDTNMETKLNVKNIDMSKESVEKNNKIPKTITINKNDEIVKQQMNTVNNYISNNLTSLATSNKRSNGARYALIKSNLRIGANHFWLGVGKGLTGAYISNNFTYEEKQNKEVNMWITNQKKEGVLRYGLGAMNEYVGRFAETGIIGLVVFLLPFIYIEFKLLKTIRSIQANEQIKILLLFTGLMGTMVAGMNGSLHVFYSTWVILGLCYAAILGKGVYHE